MYVNSLYLLGYSIYSKRTNDETRRIKERLHKRSEGISFSLFVVASRGSWKVVTEDLSNQVSSREENVTHLTCNEYEISVYSKKMNKWPLSNKSTKMISRLQITRQTTNNKLTVIMHSNIHDNT